MADGARAGLRRADEADPHGITIEAQNGTVALTGAVHSQSERQAAEHAALIAPGIDRVDDRLNVRP